MSDTLTLPKLDPEIKARWLAALRSGDYKQGIGFLHQRVDGEERLCCLGVLCDVAVKDGLVDAQVADAEENEPGQENLTTYNENTVMPPSVVTRWAYKPAEELAHLNAWTVVVSDDDGTEEQCSLTELNDQRAMTFAQIADLIEEQL